MVAALLALLVAGLLNFAGWFVAAASYDPESYENAFSASDAAKQRSMAAKTSFEEATSRLQSTAAWERYLIDVHERRFETLDLVRAVGELLPHDPEGSAPENPADRNEIHVESFDMEYVPDLAKWFQGVERDWKQTLAAAGKNVAAAPPPAVDPALGGDPSLSPPPEDGTTPPADAGQNALATGPSGPGWVVQIVGHHFHNEDRHKPKEGEQYVRETLVRGLLGDAGPVTVSAGPKAGEKVNVEALGIGFPVIVQRTPVIKVRVKTTPQPLGMANEPMATADTPDADQGIELKQYRFMLQFVWQPTIPGGSPRPKPVPAPAAPEF
jgi:hypothetical protein